jgi:uncharacterized protein (DUF3820 family)
VEQGTRHSTGNRGRPERRLWLRTGCNEKDAEVKMPFGKYKNDDIEDVPASYLMWLYEKEIAKGSILQYIEENMHGLKQQIKDGQGDI